MKKDLLKLLFGTLAVLFFISCDKDDEEDDMVKTAEMTLSVDSLPDLGDLYAYEGWIMVNGTPVSTGTFTVSESGELSQTTFEANASDLDAASAFILTIEPDPDPSPDPSDVHIIAGDFIGESANLTTSDSKAIGTSFSNATGKYFLATPTNDTNSNELSGIWWLDPTTTPPSKSLVLPKLNAGWVYEGWVVMNGTPVTTGRFLKADSADYSAPYSAALEGPSFPGEDFLKNAPTGLTFPTDLSGMKAVISIEPEPDYSDDPFVIKPLAGDIPSDATDHKLYNMDNISANYVISGMAKKQ